MRVRRPRNCDDISVNLISQDWGWTLIYYTSPQDQCRKTSPAACTCVCSVAVGLDVQNSYAPFFSGVRKHFLTQQTRTHAQLPTPKTASKSSALSQPSRQACLHKCADKRTCAHTCCKHGVSERTRRSEVSKRQPPVSCFPKTPQVLCPSFL